MRTLRSFNEFTWALIIFFVLSIYATSVNAEVSPEKEWVKGCVVVGRTNSGSNLFRPFIKTGDTEDDPDTGEVQILGYEPGNVIIKNGQVVWERVHEQVFIQLNKHKPVNGRPCGCPPYNE